MAEKGNISINAKNIMPVIKKWLYSDEDIFVRELVSNGCDAIAKLKRLVSVGEAENDQDYRVDVIIDKQEGTLTFVDNGIGMTAEEVKKYIAQVAFSGAEDFLEKYKNDDAEGSGIIGHFGLGFYSAFMVAEKVVIDTLSYQPGAEAARWISEDGMEYEMEVSDRTVRGSSMKLYLTEENKEFLDKWTLNEVLEKHCGFMPVPIFLSEVNLPEPEKVDGEEGETENKPAEPMQINDTQPLWLKKPSEVTDEEYKEFYHKCFHDFDEPLFWIHLNAEYPFNLKGILYFPKLKNELSAAEGVIKLYNNQVFVADNIKEVIPEFLMLLKGAIDCPDLPLNVSRSFLQNDGYVKKMAAYITRKVADRLITEFNTRREDYQKYWDDIHPFVKYGCLKDEKFYERVKKALIFKTSKGEYLTIEEYKNANCDEGKDAVVYYTSDEKRQAQMIAMYVDQGKDVVVLDTLLDNNFISFMEYAERDSKIRFKRVDSAADDLTDVGVVSDDERKTLEEMFRAAIADNQLDVQLKPFKSDDMISMITVDEANRRFAEMSRQWGRDMNMPEKRTLVLNDKHPIVNWLKTAEDGETRAAVCSQIVDLAEMARQPLVAERMMEFLKRSNALLTMLVK
ncbi:MAG: molecular chaperone HtpG [Clostridia bacterium]|nr:molecular chaperone HtpG [Clostridia bacterium]